MFILPFLFFIFSGFFLILFQDEIKEYISANAEYYRSKTKEEKKLLEEVTRMYKKINEE